LISKRQLIYSIAIGATLAIIACFLFLNTSPSFEETPFRLKFIYIAVIPIITVGAFILGTTISYLCFVIINIISKKQTIFSFSNIPPLIIIIIIALGVSYLYSDIYLIYIAEDPDAITQDLIERYSKNKNSFSAQIGLAKDESTPKHLLHELVKSNYVGILKELAINKNTPPDALAEIEKEAVDRYSSGCHISNVKRSYEPTNEWIYCLKKWKILRRLAYNDATPPETLRRIANLSIVEDPHKPPQCIGIREEYCLCRFTVGTGTYRGYNPTLNSIRGNPNTPADVKQMVSEHIDNFLERCRSSLSLPKWAQKIKLERYRQLHPEQ